MFSASLQFWAPFLVYGFPDTPARKAPVVLTETETDRLLSQAPAACLRYWPAGDPNRRAPTKKARENNALAGRLKKRRLCARLGSTSS